MLPTLRNKLIFFLGGPAIFFEKYSFGTKTISAHPFEFFFLPCLRMEGIRNHRKSSIGISNHSTTAYRPNVNIVRISGPLFFSFCHFD
jgi:hypothetical protein